MSRKKCPECGWLISSSADSCPHCGYRISGSDQFSWAKEDAKAARKEKLQNILITIICIIVAGPMLVEFLIGLFSGKTTSTNKKQVTSEIVDTGKTSSSTSLHTETPGNDESEQENDFYIPDEEIEQILPDEDNQLSKENIEQASEIIDTNISKKDKRRFFKKKTK